MRATPGGTMRSSIARGTVLAVLCAAGVPAIAGLPEGKSLPPAAAAGPAEVQVELIEGVRQKSWEFDSLPVTERYTEPAFGFVDVPHKYSPRGIIIDRSNPYILRATATWELPRGTYRLLLRARGAARLFVDDRKLAETEFAVPNANGADPVPELPAAVEPGLHPLPPGGQERIT